MTNSMIPYSFIPGTKAKAGEVNANFTALANILEATQINVSNLSENLQAEINEINETKADATKLVTEFGVEEEDTDLNDYKAKGTYFFSEDYTPVNIPKGTSGTLIVTGISDVIKQIWYCTDDNPEIYTRNYTNSEWSEWKSITGILNKINPGYLKFPNGLLLQWGAQTASEITYPIAFTTTVSTVATKNGLNVTYSRSDTGFESESLTGIHLSSAGAFNHMNWIAIGY